MTYKENDARQGIGMQEDEKFMWEALHLSRQAVEQEMSRLERCL